MDDNRATEEGVRDDVELRSISAADQRCSAPVRNSTDPSRVPAMPPARVDHTAANTGAGAVAGGVSEVVRQSAAAAAGQGERKNSPSANGKGAGRRVWFPEGSLVTQEIDPPNPWINAKETCTEELCAAYQAGCAQMNLKPSQNIIHQLQTVKNFTIRAEMLNLQGEKLDLKAVETLEEVFKRVQFNIIDVEGTGMDDEATMALCDMVEFYQSTCKLIFASNRSIGFRGWQAASRLLRRTPCLHTFDARNTCWTEHSMPAMSRAMRVDSSIAALHLEACNLSGRPHFLLMSALRTNSTLRELFLADNRLMPSDAIHIGGMLRHNSGLKLLDLRNNNVQDTGLSNISSGLSAQSKGGLTTLVLWNNHISHNGAAHLGKALIKNSNLETLNLGQNNLGTDGIHALKEGLMKNKSLMRLGMYSCRVSDEGAVALAEYLADNCYLMRLDLRENDIRTGGMMALSLSLKVNMILLRLDLDKDVKKESLKGHEELQQSLLSEICNHLARNRQILEQRQKEEEERARNQVEDQTRTVNGTEESPFTNSGDESASGNAAETEESVVINTRDPLMGVESSQEALLVIGSRPKSSTRSKAGQESKAHQHSAQIVNSNHDVAGTGSTSQNVEAKEPKAVSVPAPASVPTTNNVQECTAVCATQETIDSVSSSSSSPSSSSLANITMSSSSTLSSSSADIAEQPCTNEECSLPPVVRTTDNVKLLPHALRSGSITKIEIPADESKLLHSDSIDVESPTSPPCLKPLDLPIPGEEDEQEEEAVAKEPEAGSGLKTVVGRALGGGTGEPGDVPSPDTEPFGRGVPLNIDGKIGNGLLAAMSESLFLPHLQASPPEDGEKLMPSPDDIEGDIDHILAAAHGV